MTTTLVRKAGGSTVHFPHPTRAYQAACGAYLGHTEPVDTTDGYAVCARCFRDQP